MSLISSSKLLPVLWWLWWISGVAQLKSSVGPWPGECSELWTGQFQKSYKEETSRHQSARRRRKCQLRQTAAATMKNSKNIKRDEGRMDWSGTLAPVRPPTVSNVGNKNKSEWCEPFIWKNTEVLFHSSIKLSPKKRNQSATKNRPSRLIFTMKGFSFNSCVCVFISLPLCLCVCAFVKYLSQCACIHLCVTVSFQAFCVFLSTRVLVIAMIGGFVTLNNTFHIMCHINYMRW